MVRAYAPCGTGITFPSPNTAAASGTPGCTPPTPYSDFLFSDKGKCSVQGSHKWESPCGLGGPEDCSNFTWKARCSGITAADGTTLIEGSGWTLNMLYRATWQDSANGDQTVIDFPAQVTFAPAKKGRMKAGADTHMLLNQLPFFPPRFLPGCTSLEVLSVKIVDPQNRVFATMGSSTR